MKLSKMVGMTLVIVGLSFAGWFGVTSSTPAEARVEIKPEGNNVTTIEITIPGLETETKLADGENWTVVRLPGEPAITGEVGLPQLPVVIRNLALPDNAVVDVTVVEAEFEKFSGVLVYPTQKPLTEGEQPTWQVNWDFYQRDLVYPSELAKVKRQSTWRGLSFATIELNPVRYNPIKRELTVVKRLRVRVNHPGVFRRKVIEPWALKPLKTIIDNPERLNLEVRWIDSPGVRYLVITHSNYINSWLDSLVNWHQKRGAETRVIAKSSWTAAEVKDSIRAEYNRNNPPVLRWVLLVGEYNEVPGYAYPSPGVQFSDMWYADLNPPSGDDYFELGIGRFSPSSVADLENQIQKTLKFERDPVSGDWTGKAGLAAHREQYPGKYSACTRGIYHFPYPVYRYNFDTIMGGANGTNAMVTADINEGRVVINYRGHGSQTDWSTWDAQGQSWTIDHINALTNGDMTPVVINCACYNHALSTPTCLGEAWMRKYPGGAVASVGATEPSYTIPNHAWDSTLFRSIGDTFTIVIPGVRNYTCPTWDLGWMLCNADAYIVKYYGEIGTDNARMYLWLGDPALTVWTGPLSSAEVIHPPTVPLGNFDLAVNVTKSGSPVKDALVCAWKPGEFYVFGYTDVSGNVTLPICATSPGTFSLVVTGQGFPPYEGSVLARTTGAPYVTYLRSVVNDSPPGGNGDGVINPGETITLPTWVKNFGDVQADSVTGKIRTSDPYVTIVDSVKFFGDIAAGDSAFTGVSGFKFDVAPACTNGHRIGFELLCQDVNDTVWRSRIYLRVGAPSLSYVDLTVVDTIAGGNRNGRLDPEESALLMFSLRNSGYGNAHEVRARLHSGDARFLITDSIGFYGEIMAESVRTNTGDPFQVTTLSMPPETRISCTLYVTAQGGYSTVIPVSILVGEIHPCDPIPDTGGPVVAYWAYDDVDTFYTKHPEFNWVEIRNLGTRLDNLRDDETRQINLPPSFGPFVFYNQSYHQISICSNGWVAPGYTTVITWSNTALPNQSMPPLLAANWDDLYPPTGNGVWYYHDTANHRFIIEWDSVHYYSPREQWDKFEIILYDTTVTDGDCEFAFQYLTSNHNTSCTVGEQDHTSSRWIQVVYNESYHRGAAPLAPGRAILFTPDGPQVGVSESEVLGSGIPTRLAIGVVPNPLTKAGVIRWQMPVKGRMRLLVYDMAGRAVRTLVKGEVAAGYYQVVWDGTDDAGRQVANGVYIFRLESDAGRVTTKAVMLR